MAAPAEFTLDSVRDFILEKGGRVTNHELVKHFKRFLTDPDRKEAARVQFKDYVNALATIKQEDGEKYLVLKRKYFPPNSGDLPPPSPVTTPVSKQQSPFPLTPTTPDSPSFKAPPPYRPPPEPYRRPSFEAAAPGSPVREPPPAVRNPPLVRQGSSSTYDSDSIISRSRSQSSSSLDQQSLGVSTVDSAHNEPPPPAVPPRRKPTTTTAPPKVVEDLNNKENSNVVAVADLAQTEAVVDGNEDAKISVKERTQRFNKMASDIDLMKASSNGSTALSRRDLKTKNGEDDDTSSLATMEPRSKEWVLAIARGDYHVLTRLLREEPRLARRRDYITGYNGLHWAAKHGNADIIKLLAGTYHADVNARTNAGCTPLHLAAQQGNEEVFDLLVKAYGADSNLRDFSGKKPRQYFPRQESSISSDTFRKIKAKRNMAAEKESAGFLRIGSLNVRVKKTTEAFNNLLSSGNSSKNLLMDKLHKPWGSTDNLQAAADTQAMPPPKQAPPKKKRPKDWSTQTPPTELPPNPLPVSDRKEEEEDSDSAYGFGSDWNTP